MKKENKIRKTSDKVMSPPEGFKKTKLKPVEKDKYKPGKFVDEEEDLEGLQSLFDYEDEPEEEND